MCDNLSEPARNSLILKRRDVRVVEGARLESVCRGNSTVGSNPHSLRHIRPWRMCLERVDTQCIDSRRRYPTGFEAHRATRRPARRAAARAPRHRSQCLRNQTLVASRSRQWWPPLFSPHVKRRPQPARARNRHAVVVRPGRGCSARFSFGHNGAIAAGPWNVRAEGPFWSIEPAGNAPLIADREPHVLTGFRW